jgi:hypothetical protein
VTPTSRSLALLRKEGLLAEVVEKWNSFSRTKKDLLGFIDIVALDVEAGVTWGVQCTSGTNLSARIRKITQECQKAARAWLACGNKIMVVGWAKRGPRGCCKRWTPTRREIGLADLCQV